jgi:Zn-dependent protease/predicted transcriptional regulator
MDSSIRLGRIAGIEIGVHYTWLFAVALVTWSLAVSVYPSDYPRWGRNTYWLVAIVSALLLFACVLLHELSHSVVARARGMPVAGITLFIFGGVSNIRGEAKKPADEFWMALVGPLTSFAIAAVTLGLWLALGRGTSPPLAVLEYLARINFLLGVFNLIPGFPLDGGRVLRALLWAATGRQDQATRIAGLIGKAVAYLFIVGGIAMGLTVSPISGIWLAFIGWFLLNAAEASMQQASVPRGAEPRVSDLLRTAPFAVPTTMPVGEVVERYLRGGGARAVLVTENGRVAGLLSLSDIRHLSGNDWPALPASAVMTPAARLVTVRPDAGLREAVVALSEHEVNQLPVLDDGRMVGLLTRADVIAFLRQHTEANGRDGHH